MLVRHGGGQGTADRMAERQHFGREINAQRNFRILNPIT